MNIFDHLSSVRVGLTGSHRHIAPLLAQVYGDSFLAKEQRLSVSHKIGDGESVKVSEVTAEAREGASWRDARKAAMVLSDYLKGAEVILKFEGDSFSITPKQVFDRAVTSTLRLIGDIKRNTVVDRVDRLLIRIKAMQKAM